MFSRVFSTVEDVQSDVQYCGGCSVGGSVLCRVLSTIEGFLLGKIFSTVESDKYCDMQVVHYSGGCSVLWRVFSTVKDIQYCGGIPFKTAGTTISISEGRVSITVPLHRILCNIMVKKENERKR